MNYVKENYDKVRSELNRIGYFTLKNKVSIGDNYSNTKDVFISMYLMNMEMEDECNRMIQQKYSDTADIKSINGFFVASTNELVVLIKVYDTDDIIADIKRSDVRSTIEHELTHAFDSTSTDDVVSGQKIVSGVGGSFLSMCAYMGIADIDEISKIIMFDKFTNGKVLECVYAISMVIYKLFTITEFNAHQVSDLVNTHKADIRKSDRVRKALKKDISADSKITERIINDAMKITPNQLPELWEIIGRVLKYMGYNIQSDSPSSVYKYFKHTAEKLLKNFFDKKVKNQVKSIVSLKEKNSIKDKIITCIKNDNLDRGISFWFSPSGDTNSYLCRVYFKYNKFTVTINNKPIRLYGNIESMFNRAIDSFDDNNKSRFEFAIDNIVDAIIQSIERNFNSSSYKPMYDITIPQDEVHASSSNRILNRFADLDLD